MAFISNRFEKKYMKKTFVFFLFIFSSAISFGQETSVSSFAKNKIIVDGKPGDWNLPLKHYDNITGLFFDFENDANNLYLCFQTKDEMTEVKILRAGMKIILSNKINGKHKSVIDFPLPPAKTPENKDEIKPDPMAPRPSMHATFLGKDSLMQVKGFATKNGLISSRDTSGIHAAINWDSSKTFTYEIAIPLKEMFGQNYNANDLSKDISLEVVVNALSSQSRSQMSGGENGFSGRGSGERGRMGGGYGGRQGSGQFQGDRSAMFQKTQLKQKFVLATP